MYFVICYFIGNFMTGWIVGKWYGVSLQNENSGNVGARNAGRTLGKLAFCFVFFGDALKGVVAFLYGKYLGLDEMIISFGVLFCILGHLFPIFLRLKGGKGVATMIGGLISLNPILFLTLAIGTIVALPFTKSLTKSMVFGFIVYSASIFLLHKEMYFPIIFALVMITWKHRESLMIRWR